jgi:hypothetical protein
MERKQLPLKIRSVGQPVDIGERRDDFFVYLVTDVKAGPFPGS